MNAKIRKIRNQPLYEVKLYVRTLKEARDTVKMHSMTGGAVGTALTPAQRFTQAMNTGSTFAQASTAYMQEIAPLYPTYVQAGNRARLDLAGLIAPIQLTNIEMRLIDFFEVND